MILLCIRKFGALKSGVAEQNYQLTQFPGESLDPLCAVETVCVSYLINVLRKPQKKASELEAVLKSSFLTHHYIQKEGQLSFP